MSTRQTGNRHENAVMAEAEKIGYATFAARGSRGPVDVLCFEDYHHWKNWSTEGRSESGVWCIPLVIQVGTTNKPIASTLAELSAAPRPIGSLCIVARRHRKTRRLKSGAKGKAIEIVWSFHTAAGTFDSLKETLMLTHSRPRAELVPALPPCPADE